MITIMDAIQALKPGAECLVRGNEYSSIEWLDKSQTQPTEDEVNAKVTELTNAEPMNLLRQERTRILSESDWMANSDVTMTDEWKTYRQELRDLPKVHPVNYGDPKLDSNGSLDMSSITWPTPPS
tara:strand:- start:86 stop:460 length:375 start_codon:yes stop_codon:yes gene_type:complete